MIDFFAIVRGFHEDHKVVGWCTSVPSVPSVPSLSCVVFWYLKSEFVFAVCLSVKCCSNVNNSVRLTCHKSQRVRLVRLLRLLRLLGLLELLGLLGIAYASKIKLLVIRAIRVIRSYGLFGLFGY